MLEEYKRIRSDISQTITDMFNLNRVWLLIFSGVVIGALTHPNNKSIILCMGVLIMLIIQFIFVFASDTLLELAEYCSIVEVKINRYFGTSLLNWQSEIVKSKLAMNSGIFVAVVLTCIFTMIMINIASWGLENELTEQFLLPVNYSANAIYTEYLLECLVIILYARKHMQDLLRNLSQRKSNLLKHTN